MANTVRLALRLRRLLVVHVGVDRRDGKVGKTSEVSVAYHVVEGGGSAGRPGRARGSPVPSAARLAAGRARPRPRAPPASRDRRRRNATSFRLVTRTSIRMAVDVASPRVLKKAHRAFAASVPPR
ncbi:hypothetical protein EVAR_9952_1 [Eumeta japonica]|uniref:Uncharacterized protein n=1 Tax=Eumeta variegata TaxID=151549 RepID=A0A4C1TQU9_EUMVA|nr:hypothetical protein EVAR_9952_1 [Eumeta japonica]